MKAFLTAEWRNLIFANYEVDPATLAPFVPAGTELDFYNGKCILSLVAFKFINTKVYGISMPFHRDFEELNLRFYVRRKVNTAWEHGVVFIKEIVGKKLVKFVANTVYGEHFYHYPISSVAVHNEAGMGLEYRISINKHLSNITARYTAESHTAHTGSEEEFTTEHYKAFTRLSEYKTSEFMICRGAWYIHDVLQYNISIDTQALYGLRLHECLANKPRLVFAVQGAPVVMYKHNLI